MGLSRPPELSKSKAKRRIYSTRMLYTFSMTEKALSLAHCSRMPEAQSCKISMLIQLSTVHCTSPCNLLYCSLFATHQYTIFLENPKTKLMAVPTQLVLYTCATATSIAAAPILPILSLLNGAKNADLNTTLSSTLTALTCQKYHTVYLGSSVVGIMTCLTDLLFSDSLFTVFVCEKPASVKE